MLVDNEMTYDDASSFCLAQDGAKLHTISSWEDIEALENLNVLGKYLLASNTIPNPKDDIYVHVILRRYLRNSAFLNLQITMTVEEVLVVAI